MYASIVIYIIFLFNILLALLKCYLTLVIIKFIEYYFHTLKVYSKFASTQKQCYSSLVLSHLH